MIRVSKSCLRERHTSQLALFEAFKAGNPPKYELYHKNAWDGGYLNSAGSFSEKSDYLRDFENMRTFIELYFQNKNVNEVICVPKQHNDFKGFMFRENTEISKQAYAAFMKFKLDFHNCPAVRINLKTEKEILYNLISGAFNYLFSFGIFSDDMKNVIIPYHHMELFFLNTEEDISVYENLIKQCGNLSVGLY